MTKNKTAVFLVAPLIPALAYMISREVSLHYSTLLILGVIYGLVLLAGGLNFQQMIIYGLTAYLPFSKQISESFGHFGSALNFTNILVALAAASWVLAKPAQGERRWEPTPLNLPLFAFILIGIFSIFRFTLYGGDYLASACIEYSQRWGIPLLLYFVVFHIARDKATIRNLAVLIMTAVVVVALMSSIDYLTIGGGDLDDARVRGITNDPNLLAAFFNYYTFLFLGFFLVYFRRVRYWSILPLFLICFRGMMVTFSRAGYLAFFAASSAVVFIRSKIGFLLLILAAWFVFQNPVLLPRGIRYRLGQTVEKNPAPQRPAASVEDSLDPSAKARLEVWRGALWMIREHPVLGVGYSLFPNKIQHYWSGKTPIDAHNTYLLIAAEMGIPALFIFLWMIGLMFWNAFSLYGKTADLFSKSMALGFMGGIVGFVVSNLFGSRHNAQEVSSYFWILAAMVMRLKILDRKEQTLREVTEGYRRLHEVAVEATSCNIA